MSKMITLQSINLRIDKENVFDYATTNEAKEIALKQRKRVMKYEDVRRLSLLPHIERDGGMWFAETWEDLRNPEKSVFFPFTGYYSREYAKIYHKELQAWYLMIDCTTGRPFYSIGSMNFPTLIYNPGHEIFSVRLVKSIRK